MTQIRDTFEDQVFFNTILIENLTDGEFGTGFLLKKNVGNNQEKQLLFSNKHVFWGMNDHNKEGIEKDLQLTFHKNDDDQTYNLGTVQKAKIHLKRVDDGYYEHPDSPIDVACINVSEIYNQVPIANRSIDVESFSSFSLEDVFIGQKILFVGYPQYFFDIKNFLPVARFGTIASIPSIDFNGEQQILIDASVLPGSSGSPVFFQQVNGQYKLLGIISSAPIREIEYTLTAGSTGKSKQKIPVQRIGFGMLFKLSTLKTVYDLVE